MMLQFGSRGRWRKGFPAWSWGAGSACGSPGSIALLHDRGTGQCPNTLPPVRDSVALYRGKPSSKIHCHGIASPLYPVSHDCTIEEAPNTQVEKMTSVYVNRSLTPVISVHAPKLVWAQKYGPYLLKTDLASIILLSV